MTKIDTLLAKSGAQSPGQTLQGHTWQVMASAQLLLDNRLAAAERAIGKELPWLQKILPLAAFLHDLGKANDVFQRMVRGQNVVQPVRHEALSVLIAKMILWDWLREGYTEGEIDLALVIAAGHHRKFPARAVAESGAGAAGCTVLAGHPDFAKVLQLGVSRLELPAVPVLADWPVTRRKAEKDLMEAQVALRVPVDVDLAVAKAFLLCADVLGSAEPVARSREKLLVDALSCRATAQELQDIADQRLGGHPPRPFQHAVAGSRAPVTLVTAGCGSGKTVAAYLWARQHAGRQLWMCYPTTGTATEGYRDYLDIDLETRLDHGRREVDISMFGLTEGGDPASVLRDATRSDSLKNWGAKVVSCTVDTVLGLMQCHRKGVYAWPGLAEAAVVFDEVHAYDRGLFGSLLRFLEAMPGTPVLLMTATMPEPRLARLRDLVQRVHGQALVDVQGPADLEALRRYVRSHDEADVAVDRCLGQGGKVLWVCNSVGPVPGDRRSSLARSSPAVPLAVPLRRPGQPSR